MTSTIELTLTPDDSIHEIAETIASLFLRANDQRSRRGQQRAVPVRLHLEVAPVELSAEDQTDLRRAAVTGYTDGPVFLSPTEVRAFFDPANLPSVGTMFPSADPATVASDCSRMAELVIQSRKHCAF